MPVISARLLGIRGRLAGRLRTAGPARVRPVQERPEDAEVAAWADEMARPVAGGPGVREGPGAGGVAAWADEMARHVAAGPEIYRPGAFWTDLLERNLAML